MSELLTVKEVAKILQVNSDKTYELIRKGHLQALKLGRLKVPRWAVDEFIKSNIGKDLTDLNNIKDMEVSNESNSN